jgi:hypothetical protein
VLGTVGYVNFFCPPGGLSYIISAISMVRVRMNRSILTEIQFSYGPCHFISKYVGKSCLGESSSLVPRLSAGLFR